MRTRLLLLAAILAGVIIVSSGCYYGTFHSPKAMGMGKTRVRTCGSVPSYFNKDARGDAEKSGMDYGEGMVKGMITYGAGKRMDAGIHGTMYSAGIHAKWWAIMSPEAGKKSVDVAPMIWLDYFYEMKKIAPKYSIIVGYPTSRIAEFYIGYEGFWGPSIPKIMHIDTDDEITWASLEDEVIYQDSVFMGFDIDFRDAALTIELGYPLRPDYQEYPMMFIGIGVAANFGGIPGM